jgi:hypothetical protein
LNGEAEPRLWSLDVISVKHQHKELDFW